MKVIQPCKDLSFFFFNKKSNALVFRVADRLWRAPGDDLAVSQLTNHWRSTLMKKGCRNLMQSGMSSLLPFYSDSSLAIRCQWTSSIDVTLYRWYSLS